MPGIALTLMPVEGVKLFGVRHHGPGSARSLLHALEAFDPDAVLIEGPPDANELLPLAAREDLQPPVALLVYAQDSPKKAVMYPFASFSPEWQAMRFALSRGRVVRFIDLPHTHRLADAMEQTDDEQSKEEARGDPLKPFALAAGFNDAERWWDQFVESRAGDDLEVFSALHEMMTAVRKESPFPEQLSEQRREAYMRKCIRAAKAEGFARIAVVCGAYHTPALDEARSARQDEELLRGLPKIKTSSAWVPWSYERLSFSSGYGAGIESPLWYELLWTRRDALGAEWITRAARLLRAEDVPASSAHVIEACRLADALAAVRARPLPGLSEYNDAAVAVLGAGNPTNLRLIHSRWHFDGRLGKVPEDFPAAPLQRDLAALQKRLRLAPKAEEKTLDLDLREANDRERSHVLRRLRILGVEWGKPSRQAHGGKGTFHELWVLLWRPDFAIVLVEASRYGHTVMQAAAAVLAERSANTERLADLVSLLDDALFADLADAVEPLVAGIERRAAAAADFLQLLDAIPPLVNVYRYGNVRETDVRSVAHILDTLVPRMFIGFAPAVVNIDTDAAKQVLQRVGAADQALRALGDDEFIKDWQNALLRVGAGAETHALLAGYAHRLLYDAKTIDFDQLESALSLALSLGNSPETGASWIEGLLAGGGALLIHDDRLRSVLDHWLRQVPEPHFMQVLPLLRRTFSQFAPAERRMLGERLRSREVAEHSATSFAAGEFDEAAAQAVLPVLQSIWSKGDKS